MRPISILQVAFLSLLLSVRLVAQTRTAHPYYCAAFMLQGDPANTNLAAVTKAK